MAGALDIDLHCLNCGYNLRGLSGEMIRCPECGNDNPIGDVEPPAPIISAQLRKMETAPAMCALMAIFSICLAVAFLPELLIGRVTAEDTTCVAVPLATAFFVWLYNARWFREHCMSSPGWLGALVRYHLTAIGLTAPMILVPVVMGFLSDSNGGRAAIWRHGHLFVAALMLGFLVLKPLALRMHRQLKRILDPLQRAVAVKVARDKLRTKIMHRRGRPFGK
ncbi:MAG: hypothetical protein JXO22_06630 [Phycisphaerae bacterium]|nr:hypothetical protein [Phycisphaerae bacterium]